MDKIKDWIKKYKGLSVILLLAVVFLIVIIVIFVELLVGGSHNKYGNRLDGIDKVKISEKTYDGVKKEVEETNLTEEVETRLQGRIVYTTITLKSDTSVDKAKEIASNTLDNYTNSELEYYDFSFFLKWKGEEKDTVITGNKHLSLDAITWTNSQEITLQKRNNKIIVLIVVAVLFAVSLLIFILNYSKDNSSFSILEKKWINDNTSNVLDISVYNDVPVYGKSGKGVIFDLLDDFTTTYGINFNKISYSVDSSSNLNKNAFRVLNNNESLTNKDILLYEDNYVLVSTEEEVINNINDIDNHTVAVLKKDLNTVSNDLSEVKKISYLQKENVNELEEALKNKETNYVIVPYNMYMDFILKNDLHILYHLSDISKKYVLTIENKTFLDIMKKYYLGNQKNKQQTSYKTNFLSEFFYDKEITEADRMSYNSSSYNVGYITYMPFTGKEEKDLVGTLSNYLSGFEDIYAVDFKLKAYDSIELLKKDLSNGTIDVAFANFNTNGMNIDTLYTPSLFKEEYVVLSKDKFVVNSIKSLRDKEVSILKDSYINDLVTASGIKYKAYNNTDDLIRNVSSDTVLVIDKDTYEYYRA